VTLCVIATMLLYFCCRNHSHQLPRAFAQRLLVPQCMVLHLAGSSACAQKPKAQLSLIPAYSVSAYECSTASSCLKQAGSQHLQWTAHHKPALALAMLE
jgi:hypothetical protein